MILGGKLPGKVGRCRFYFFLFCKPAASLLSESTLFHDGIGFAARKKSVKLGMPRYMDVAGFLLP